MTQNTNLNVSPYFDDFDEDNNYNKVLFKPGFPVQSRELTTLQSILQGQIEKFGQHFFKEGSMIVPGGIIYDSNYFAVKIDPTFLDVPVSAYTSYLKDNNLTQFYSTMDGHTCHATRQDISNILTKLNLDGICSSWNQVLDSNHSSIVPLNSPVDTGPYTNVLEPKPYIKFTEPVYYENVCLIKLNSSQRYYNAERFIKSFCPW